MNISENYISKLYFSVYLHLAPLPRPPPTPPSSPCVHRYFHSLIILFRQLIDEYFYVWRFIVISFLCLKLKQLKLI